MIQPISCSQSKELLRKHARLNLCILCIKKNVNVTFFHKKVGTSFLLQVYEHKKDIHLYDINYNLVKTRIASPLMKVGGGGQGLLSPVGGSLTMNISLC